MTSPASWFSSLPDPFQWLLDEQKKIDEAKRQKDLELASLTEPSGSQEPFHAIESDDGPNEKMEEKETSSPLREANLDQPDEIVVVEPEDPLWLARLKGGSGPANPIPDEIVVVEPEAQSWLDWLKEWTEPMMPIDGKDINPFSVSVAEDAVKTRRASAKEIEKIRKEKLPPELISRNAAPPLILSDSVKQKSDVEHDKDVLLVEKRKKTDEELKKFNAAITAYSLFLFLHEYAAGQPFPIEEDEHSITYQKMVRRALEPKEGEEHLSLWQVYKEFLGKDLSLFAYIKAFLFYHVFFTISEFVPTLVNALTKGILDSSRKSLIRDETLAYLSSRILSYADTYLHIIDGARITFRKEHHVNGSEDDYIRAALEKSFSRKFEDLIKEDSSKAVDFFLSDSISFCSLGENSSFIVVRKISETFSAVVNFFTNALVRIILKKFIIPSIFRSVIANAIDVSPQKSYIFTRGIYEVATNKVKTIREDLENPPPMKEAALPIAGTEKLTDVSRILVTVLDTSPNQQDDLSEDIKIGIEKGGKIALETLHDKKVMEELFASLFSSLYGSLTSEETFQELKEQHDMWEEALNLESDELFTTLTDQAIQEKLSRPSQSLEEQTKSILSNIKAKSQAIFSQLQQLTPIIERIASSINDPKKALAVSERLQKALFFAQQISTSIDGSIASPTKDPEKFEEFSILLLAFLHGLQDVIPLFKHPEKTQEAYHQLLSLIPAISSSSSEAENISASPLQTEELSTLVQQIVSWIQETEKERNIPFEHGFAAIEIFCNLMQKINQQLDLKKIIREHPEMSDAQQKSFDRMLQPIRVEMLKLTGLIQQLNVDQNSHYLCAKAERSLNLLLQRWKQTKLQLKKQDTSQLIHTFAPTLRALQEIIRLHKQLELHLGEEAEDLEAKHRELSKLLEIIQEETSITEELRSLIEDDTSLPLVARLVHLRQYPDKPLDYFDAKALKRKVLEILIASDLNEPPFTSMIDRMQTYIPPHLRKDWDLFQAFILSQVKEDREDLKALLKGAFEEWKQLPRGRGSFDLDSWKESARQVLEDTPATDRENIKALLVQTESFLTKNSIIPVYWNHFCQQIRLKINHRTLQRDQALRLYQDSTFIPDFLETQFSNLHHLQQTTHTRLQTNLSDVKSLLSNLSNITGRLELGKSYSPTQVITGLGIAGGIVIGGATALVAPAAAGAVALTTIGTVASHFYDPHQSRPISAAKGLAVGTLLSVTGPVAPLLAGPAIGYYAGQRVKETATEYARDKILPRIKTMRENLFKLIPKVRKAAAYALLEGFSNASQTF